MKTMIEWKNRIIIGGLPRSGSTLLRWHLDASKEIIAPAETTFLQFLLNYNQDLVESRSRRINQSLMIGEEKISEIILQSNSSIEAFDLIMEEYASERNSRANVWVEKTPWNCLSYSWLARERDDLWFISTVRDGRDVVTSKHWNKEKSPFQSGFHCPVQRYVDAMGLIYSFDHPKHLIIKYEDFVDNPKGMLVELFNTIGLTWDDDILENARVESASRQANYDRQPLLKMIPTTERIGRWERPEYKEKIEEFYSHSDATFWLESSGYRV